ncbi:MAG: hypothetical protein K6D91_08995 [Prevotella sp.]|nr:hypothetical protein [Prevotella sp.]
MFGLLLLIFGLQNDSLATSSQHLDEVVVVSRGQGGKRSVKGQAATIDEHLQELKHVELVRRGSYAWEPTVNSMQTERLSTTIDGMKIFYACTDKMDPVTSYVESSNLQSISLNSGLNGNPQATGNIGGALDLKLRKAGYSFDGKSYRLGANTGYETNGHVQVYGADGAYSSSRFYANGGAFYRHADNYKAGNNRMVDFSQFQKVNAFMNSGYRIATNDAIETTFIFDRATDVGYPALNMDVAKAEAFITSLAYKHLFHNSALQSWETKGYYNHITHVMDDTTRPDVQIHMDMPGKSWTTGVYSMLNAQVVVLNAKNDVSLNIDSYYNRLFADMTMYPGGAAPMYMVTWPDVGTLNMGAALNDHIRLSKHASLLFSGKLSWQHQRLNNKEGYQALSVFFPGMHQQYHQTTGRIAASYLISASNMQFSTGIGWGSRAPSVTEAYGYYLNNTFDQYDYIGNPRLKNESAVEVNMASEWSLANDQWTMGLEANAFFFSNYIIGQFEDRLSAMTVGAEGVKVYSNISHATIANFSLSAEWRPTREWRWSTKGSYSIGQDNADECLPLIAPLRYQSRLSYTKKALSAHAEVKGHMRQTCYGSKYGETETAAWTIVNLAVSYQLTSSALSKLRNADHRSRVVIRAGVENLFDRNYSTYADWCHIPQKGRNIYLNFSFDL